MLSLSLAALVLVAADKPVGSWDCTSSTPNGGGEHQWTLTVKEVDGKLAGTAGSEDGEIQLEELKYEDGTLSFKVSLESGTYEVTLKIDGDKLDGNWKGGGETGTVKGVKKA
jgi:hypothetical protein